MPAMPLTPCWPPPVITSISCLDGWSSCCLDSWRLKKQRSPFNGSENRKLHGRLSATLFVAHPAVKPVKGPPVNIGQLLDEREIWVQSPSPSMPITHRDGNS